MDRRTIVTPEAVAIDADLAGLGSRFIALLIDSLIQAAVMVALSFTILRDIDNPGMIALTIVLVVAVLAGYHAAFEILWSGQTPGKRAQRIRVVQADGSPVSVTSALLRNLMRLVDFLPSMYAAGAITILVDARSRRLGDLVAGTIVVREPRAPEPSVVPTSPAAQAHAARVDAARLDHADYAAVRGFLERRAKLDPLARVELARTLAAAVRSRVGAAEGISDEELLEAAAHAFRERFRT